MQHPQGYTKNVTLGIAFISIIVISWFLFFYSKKDFNKHILNPQNIDSIEVYNPKFNFTIVNKKQIQTISKELQKAKKINLDKTNINRGFTDLFFSLKNNKEERIRIYDNAYHGFIIVSHNTFYKNDSLIYLINEFAKSD